MADVQGNGVDGAVRELQEERERSQKMKQENQVLLKKLHDVVGRYRQLQQQYQTMVNERQDQEAAAGGDGAAKANGDASPTNHGTAVDDAAAKKLEAEKHELIEKLKQVVGTCRIMQKQLQEAKEENEALKSPAKPMLGGVASPSKETESMIEALQVRIIGLERDVAQKEEEKQEIVGKLKEVISRYQSLQRQLEEKMGEHDAALSKVAALELELRTHSSSSSSSSSSSGMGWRRRGSGQDKDQAKDKEIVKLKEEVQKLTIAMNQEEARTAVFREENARVKEQVTALLQEKHEQQRQFEADSVTHIKQISDLQREIKLMRKQQEDSEQLYLEVASKLNHTLRENGDLQSRLAALQRSAEESEQLKQQVTIKHASELEQLRGQLERANALSQDASSSSDQVKRLQQQMEGLAARAGKLFDIESELADFGVGSTHASITEFVRAKDAKYEEERAAFEQRIQELTTVASSAETATNQHQEELSNVLKRLEGAEMVASEVPSMKLELEGLRSREAAHLSSSAEMEKTMKALKSIISEKDEKLATAHDAASSQEEELIRHREQIAHLQSELTASAGSSSEQLKHSLEKISDLEQTLLAVREELKTKLVDVEALEASVGELQGQLSEKEQVVTDLTGEQDQLKSSLDDLRTVEERLESEAKMLKSQLESAVIENDQLIAQVASLEQQLVDVQNGLESGQRALIASHSARVAELECEVEKRKGSASALRDEIEELSAEISSVRDEHATAIRTAEDTTSERAASHEATLATRREQMNATIADYEARLAKKDDRIATLQVEIASLQTQVMTLEAQELQSDADTAEIMQLREQLASAESERESARKESAQHLDEVMELQAQISHMAVEHEALLEQTEFDFNETRSELMHEADNLRGEVERYREELVQARHFADVYAQEVSRIRELLVSLPLGNTVGEDPASVDIDGLITTIGECIRKVEAYERERQQLASSADTLRDDLVAAKTDAQHTASRVDQCEAEILALNTQLQDLSEENARLVTEVESERRKVVQHLARIDDMAQEIAALREQKESEASNALHEANEKLIIVRSRLSEAESEMDSIKAENTRMVFEVAKTTDSAVKLKQDFDDLEDRWKGKCEAHDQLEEFHRALQAEKVVLEEQLRSSAVTLEQIRGDWETYRQNAEQEISLLNDKIRVITESLEGVKQELALANKEKNALIEDLAVTKTTLVELGEVSNDFARLTERVVIIESEKHDLSEQLSVATTEKKALADELSALQASTTQQVILLESGLNAKTAELAEALHKLEMTETEKLNREEEILQLREEMTTLKSTLDHRSDEADAIVTRLTGQVEESTATVAQKDEIIRELESGAEASATAIEDLEKKLAESSQGAEQELSKLRAQVEESTATVAQKDEIIRELESGAEASATAIEDLEKKLAESSQGAEQELSKLRTQVEESTATVAQKDEIISKLRSKAEEVVMAYKKLKEHAQELQERVAEKSTELTSLSDECTALRAANQRFGDESLIGEGQRQELQNEVDRAKLELSMMEEKISANAATLTAELLAAQQTLKALQILHDSQMLEANDKLAARQAEWEIQVQQLEEQKNILVSSVESKEHENHTVVENMKELSTRYRELQEAHKQMEDDLTSVKDQLSLSNAQLAAFQAEHAGSSAAHGDTVAKLEQQIVSLRAQLEVEAEGAEAARSALEAYKKRAATALKRASLETRTSIKKVEVETTQLQDDINTANARVSVLEQELAEANASLAEANNVAESRVRSIKEKAEAEKSSDEAKWRQMLASIQSELVDLQATLAAKSHLDERIQELESAKLVLEKIVEDMKNESLQKNDVGKEMIAVKDREIAELAKQLEESKRAANEAADQLKKATEEARSKTQATASAPQDSVNLHTTNGHHSPTAAEETHHLATAVADVKPSIPLTTATSNPGTVDSQILKLARAQAMRDEAAATNKKHLQALEEQVHLFQKKYEDTLALLEESNRQKRRIQELSARSTDGLNIEYLKNVVIKYIESQNQSDKDRLIPVIAAVLHFSPQEMKKIHDASQKAQEESAGILGGVFSLFGGAPAAPAPKPLAMPTHVSARLSASGTITGGINGVDGVDDDEPTPLNPFASNNY